MTNVGGIRVTGGSYPASVFGGYYAEAMKGVPATSFPAPDLSDFGKPEAVKLSKEKYCSATLMLARTAEITYDIKIIEGDAIPTPAVAEAPAQPTAGAMPRPTAG